MKYKGKMNTLSLVCICLAVSCLFGIAYAVFTQNIRLSGTGTVEATKWDVHLEAPFGLGQFVTEPSISQDGLTISFDGNVDNSGNSFSIFFFIVNDGNFDAELTAINFRTPQCYTTIGGISSDATKVCSSLHYNNIGIQQSNNNWGTLSTGFVIHPGESYYAVFEVEAQNLEFGEIGDTDPITADVEIRNLGVTFVFEQV